ncbi:hypothetical protein CKAN_02767100 [Cinnamomum micranthum f. kanehirae]|uniref:Uncharacterized protein n=1 Tax=Cinnamomum micranthum f. kanehirae TaxID=337451 RepID=A0A3S3P0N2_9MAGN|nr:hypothetical protein CKAN_02767100 [Cinnamomum micranthum f. kanehirae]
MAEKFQYFYLFLLEGRPSVELPKKKGYEVRKPRKEGRKASKPTLKDQLTLDRKGFRSKLSNLFRSQFRIRFPIRLVFRHPESRWL